MSEKSIPVPGEAISQNGERFFRLYDPNTRTLMDKPAEAFPDHEPTLLPLPKLPKSSVLFYTTEVRSEIIKLLEALKQIVASLEAGSEIKAIRDKTIRDREQSVYLLLDRSHTKTTTLLNLKTENSKFTISKFLSFPTMKSALLYERVFSYSEAAFTREEVLSFLEKLKISQKVIYIFGYENTEEEERRTASKYTMSARS